MKVKYKRLDKGLPKPRYAHEGDAAFDLCITQDVELEPGESKMVGTGLAVEIPDGYVGIVASRSGIGGKQGISLRNGIGIIDSGYRGEVGLPLHSTATSKMLVPRGARAAQMLVIKCKQAELVEVDELSDTERGQGGFGSTGVK
jgi:dUTP pyrophosphatase